ncbi:MATE family efflux transporter [Rhodobacteraceae bacterium D3-12]|nr:MATE family efflux transporter [Rhodobacteraceae bacterium D3-12]
MSERMTYSGHLRAVLKLGVPLVGGNLAQFGITITDTVMLGWYDVEALAAQVLGGMVFFVLFIFGSGLALAVMPAVAEAEATGDATRVRRVTRMGLWASVAFALACFPAFIFARALLEALGQAPVMVELAAQYLEIAGFAIVFALAGMVLKSYLSALEHTLVVLWATVAAAVLNAVLNYALIFGNWGAPELGIRGAAVASFVVQVLLLVILLAYILRVVPQHHLFQRLWKIDGEAMGLVVRLGLPIGLTSLAEVSLFAASSVMMGWLGTAQLAAHGIALQISSATFMVHLALSSAATVRAGRALGRRDPEGLKRGGIVVVAVSMLAALASVVLFLTVPGWLVGLFLAPDDPARGAVLAIGVALMAAAALFQLVDAAQVMALGLLRGVMDTRVPMMMAVLAYWVIGVPTSYALGFPLGYGGVGIWLGLAIGLAVAAALLMWRFWRVSLARALPEA